jgi:hypothetical protein
MDKTLRVMVQRMGEKGGSDSAAATELVEWYSAAKVPVIIDRAGGTARKRFLEFFTATIRNEDNLMLLAAHE